MADVERAAGVLLDQQDTRAGFVDLNQLVEDQVNVVGRQTDGRLVNESQCRLGAGHPRPVSAVSV